jgi:hypothetical protein
VTRFLLLTAAALMVAAPAFAGTAAARLTRAEYLTKLRTADAVSSRRDNAALAALQSKRTTSAQVKAAFSAMGAAHVRVGKQFAAIVPPRAATKANRDFAAAEILLGRQNEAIARRLPDAKPAIARYLRSLKPPTGGALLDHAIAELHNAGFNIR